MNFKQDKLPFNLLSNNHRLKPTFVVNQTKINKKIISKMIKND
jgi:hypothetical protein